MPKSASYTFDGEATVRFGPEPHDTKLYDAFRPAYKGNLVMKWFVRSGNAAAMDDAQGACRPTKAPTDAEGPRAAARGPSVGCVSGRPRP